MKDIEYYKHELIKAIEDIPSSIIIRISEYLTQAKKDNHTVFLIGNGGSSSTPSHSAGDWLKELRLKCFCLTDNTATVTAYANDLSYDDIFTEQLKILLDESDIVIAYSGSGNSPNVIKAIEYANSIGAKTIGLTGNYRNNNGGVLAKISKIKLVINSDNMEIIEDCHLIINHIIKTHLKAIYDQSL